MVFFVLFFCHINIYVNSVILKSCTYNCSLIRETTYSDSQKLSEESKELLKCMQREEPPPDATILCCLNRNVALYNAIALSKLSGRRKVYVSKDTGCKKLLMGLTSAEKELALKLGAPVIITVNLPNVPNGTRAYVVGLDNENVTVKLENGALLNIKKFLFHCNSPTQSATRFQFPLKLAWSLTIHRAQGQTLRKVHIDCEGLFLPAMLPVALSRVRSSQDVTISNLDLSSIQPVPDVVRRWINGEDVSEEASSDTMEVSCY